ncbi:MAG: hypothetical protein OEW75_00435 [Cyclobacteriaceae bacterium]|nr:hypothetical protein [Cyclobacteriaceae bacterium]
MVYRITHTGERLTFNSGQRGDSLRNKFNTFQDQEKIEDLDLGWVQFKWRNHMPEIGRFFNVDPLADKYVYNSPYAFSENKVTAHVELEGLEAEVYLVLKLTEMASHFQSAKEPMQRLVTGTSGDNVPKSQNPQENEINKLTATVGDAGKVADAVNNIERTVVLSGAETLEGMGEGIEIAGKVFLQPEITGAGRMIYETGKGIRIVYDSENVDWKSEAIEFGVELTFGEFGKMLNDAVKAGNLDEKAANIFRNYLKVWEETSKEVSEEVTEEEEDKKE